MEAPAIAGPRRPELSFSGVSAPKAPAIAGPGDSGLFGGGLQVLGRGTPGEVAERAPVLFSLQSKNIDSVTFQAISFSTRIYTLRIAY